MTYELTAGQIAKLVGVTRKTIKMWRDAGKIAYRPIPLPGGRMSYAYPRSEATRILKEKQLATQQAS